MKSLFLLLILFSSIGSALDAREVQENNELRLIIGGIFEAYHKHIQAWENVPPDDPAPPTKTTKTSVKAIKKLISKLKRQKVPKAATKKSLSIQFEKSLSLLNVQLDALDKSIEDSPAMKPSYMEASESIEATFEKYMPQLPKYVGSAPQSVKE